MRIRAVTFDVGGTLIEPWPSVGHVYAEVAGRFGVTGVPPERLTQNFLQAWKAQSRFDYARESWFALVRETFAEQAAHLPQEFYPAVYDQFAEAAAWRIYDDVRPALETLAISGVRLGIISNWDSRLRPLLRSLDLTRHFSSIVVSCEAGAAKPDPTLFKRAAGELGVSPGEMLHVGDSHAMDVLGARDAGVHGRQVARGQPPENGLQLALLTELPALLSSWPCD